MDGIRPHTPTSRESGVALVGGITSNDFKGSPLVANGVLQAPQKPAEHD